MNKIAATLDLSDALSDAKPTAAQLRGIINRKTIFCYKNQYGVFLIHPREEYKIPKQPVLFKYRITEEVPKSLPYGRIWPNGELFTSFGKYS